MLTYDLSKRDNCTIYEYLYQCIKRDILDGVLQAGEKLPSKREFARHHQISMKTVENTYEQLLTEGYIYSEEKRGYFVMALGKESGNRTSTYENHMPFSVYQGDVGEEHYFVDFTSNQASIEKFPFGTWAKIMRNVLTEKESELLKTVSFQGIFELRRASVVHVSPGHHFPTGSIMPIARRRQLLEWAEQDRERYIIEDDYDSEFRFSRMPVPAIQSINHNHRVIYLNTFSKTLAPSIRISYMVLPRKLMERYIDTMNFYSCTVSAFEQYAMAEFMSRGYFERHIHRMKKYYKEKRDCLLKVLEESPLRNYVTIDEKDAGNHFLMKLHTSLSDTELKWFARENGIKLDCLSEYCVQAKEAFAHTVIVNYSDLEEASFHRALEILAEAIIM